MGEKRAQSFKVTAAPAHERTAHFDLLLSGTTTVFKRPFERFPVALARPWCLYPEVARTREIYFVADAAGGSDWASGTVTSGQPSAFQRSGMIASVAWPSM